LRLLSENGEERVLVHGSTSNFVAGGRVNRLEEGEEDCEPTPPAISRAVTLASVGSVTETTGQLRAQQLLLPATRDVLPDSDGDGWPDPDDNCPLVFNPDQPDLDGDGVGDSCDLCPDVADPSQRDRDGNGLGDACEGPPRLAIERAGGQLRFSWPASTPPSVGVFAGPTLAPATWTPLDLPPVLDQGRFHVNMPLPPGNLFANLQVNRCDCERLVFHTNAAVLYDSVHAGKPLTNGTRRVNVTFTILAQLTCSDTPRSGDQCKGKIKYALAQPAEFGGNGFTNHIASGERTAKAPCHGKPTQVAAEFYYQATVTNSTQFRGTLMLLVTLECPVGTVVDSRTLKLVIDSSMPGSVPSWTDPAASDLDGDGLTGANEVRCGTEDGKYDSNGNGVSDAEEDPDGDGRKNRDEIAQGRDPLRRD
jgi:hypothetical protein